MKTRRRSKTTTTARFASPFPPLELTAGDEARLEDMAHFLVQSTIAEYQSHLSNDDGVVDHDQWKFVKRKQRVRVYVERSEKDVARRRKRSTRQYESMLADMAAGMSASQSASSIGSFCCFESTWSSTTDIRASSATCSSAANRSIRGGLGNSIRRDAQRVRSSLGLPAFLVAGSVEGSLDDAMFGAVSPTVDEMRVKASYVGDGLVDAAVLATIISPTEDDPFRSLSVKWVEREAPVPRLLGTLVKNHDAVVLESTGVARLASGERIGYVLLHSVQFPETQALASVARVGVSMCTLFKETAPMSVDVFTIGNVDPVNGVMRPLAAKSTVDGLLSVRRLVECARLKKLAWALSQQYACSIGDISEDESGDADGELVRPSRDGERTGEVTSLSCTYCKRQAPPPPSRRHFLSKKMKRWRRRAVCVLCSEYVCSSCTVTQTLNYVATPSKSYSAATDLLQSGFASPTAAAAIASPPRSTSAAAARRSARAWSTSTTRHHQHHEHHEHEHLRPETALPPPPLRQREITFCALCVFVAGNSTSTLAVATEAAAAATRNSGGHKSLIAAWLRGTLDLPPLYRDSES